MTQQKTHRTQRALQSAGVLYHNAWAQFDQFRRGKGSTGPDWADWCYMPIAASMAVVQSHRGDMLADPAILTALATWRMTRGIYRFDPALLGAVIDTPLDTLPVDHLYRLPEWCVYVETPDMLYGALRMHGFWAHLECDVGRGNAPELRFVLDTAPDPRQVFAGGMIPRSLILTHNTIEDSLMAVTDSGMEMVGLHLSAAARRSTLDDADLLRRLVSMVLYLCADADLTVSCQTRRPCVQRAQQPAAGPTQWDVGLRIGAALRAAYQREQTGENAAPTGRHVRPHVRRAHWHTVLSGPRKIEGDDVSAADRQRDLRWMPPIPVNIEDVDLMPAVVRPVKDWK